MFLVINGGKKKALHRFKFYNLTLCPLNFLHLAYMTLKYCAYIQVSHNNNKNLFLYPKIQ